MKQSTTTPASGITAAILDEDQHYALYQARHLLGLLYSLTCSKAEFTEIRMEHLCVSLGHITDLMDIAVTNLVFKPKGA